MQRCQFYFYTLTWCISRCFFCLFMFFFYINSYVCFKFFVHCSYVIYLVNHRFGLRIRKSTLKRVQPTTPPINNPQKQRAFPRNQSNRTPNIHLSRTHSTAHHPSHSHSHIFSQPTRFTPLFIDKFPRVPSSVRGR